MSGLQLGCGVDLMYLYIFDVDLSIFDNIVLL